MHNRKRGPVLGSVRWTEVFESMESDAFEEVARLAGEVSRAPIALITLVDEDRHWFTSVVGTHLTAGPWEQTFCAHAVQQQAVFVVPDATRDARFAMNPLVRAAPHIRFYAGAPLLTDNRVVGTLCVMDVAPRDFPSESAASLAALARQVVTQLHLRRQTRQLGRLNDALAAEARERTRTEARLRDSEQALRSSQEALQRTDAERRQLVANVSHDLRTPLTALQGYLDTILLKGDVLDPAEQRHYVQQASTQSRRLARLVADLFELAQLDDRQVQLKAEPFTMPELISDVVQAFGLAANAKHVALTMDLEDRSAVVMGEVRLLERVLDNLLDNAIRFTPPGGTVSVACACVGEHVVVRVIDTGPGIADVERERIFDRFYRGPQPAATSPAGAGIGLSIARRIVVLHGGDLTVAPGNGGGAQFAFSLPRIPSVPPAPSGVAGP
ncbi:MAG: GAF domain-containing sensor histidine kinase [Acidobacteria bacterium]|nr:GAF domain-containing sensor histidine kinase [Acidobacteriota bacterium]